MKNFVLFFLFFGFFPSLYAQWNKAVMNTEGKYGCRQKKETIHFTGYKQSNLLNDYDVRFYFLDIHLENNSTYIAGKVTITSGVISPQLDTFAVELIDNLTVDSVLINGVPHNFVHHNDHIFVPLANPLLAGNIFSASIVYHGDPQVGGSFFSGISTDISPSWGNSVTWTLSEPFNANQWWPCKQILTDKADSSWVFITTTNPNKAGSNGLLTAVVPLPNNKSRFEWKNSYPIAYYLISAAVARYIDYSFYAHPAGTSDSLLIQNFVYDNPATLPYFKVNIDRTADFIELYSDLFGLYPFMREKYGHCMAPLGGGMEHQTMTTLGYFNFYLVCHELAHQWWGNNVTCGTWSDIWINEGFATYGEYLAAQYLWSYSEAQSHMFDIHDYVMSEPDGSIYIPPSQTNDEERIFDGRLSYAKGAAVIHMIRFELQNDSLFFTVLKTFQNIFRDSVATGLDFKQVLENVSGQDFTDFFNQWYFGEGYPTYHISWNQSGNVLHFTSTQTTSSTITPLFKMLMEYKISYPGGDTLIRVYQTANVNTYDIPFSKPVTGITVDPNNWVVDGNPTVIGTTEDYKNPAYFTLAPNPCKEELQIFIPNSGSLPVKFNVLNLTGQMVFSLTTEAENVTLNTEVLPPGIYWIKAERDGERLVKKFIKL